MSPRANLCQIYLVIDDGPGSLDRLSAALAAAPIASVLIRRTASGTPFVAPVVKPLIDKAQKLNVAAILADDAALARTLRADGVHLSPGPDLMERYESARDILGRGAIVGVDAGGSRHLAMEAGEAGADYVAFGAARLTLPHAEEDDVLDDALIPQNQSTVELVGWWSEIFEVPCVALDAADMIETEKLIQAGADFIGVDIKSGTTIADTVQCVRNAAGAAGIKSAAR